MNITILDLAIIALPLAILLMAFLSITRPGVMSRSPRDPVEARKAALKEHIRTIQARAERNLVPLKLGPRREPAGSE
jgi:hypothetical protein